MNDGQVCLGTDGELCLSGLIDYRNGLTLRQAGQALIRQQSAALPLVINCSAVEKSSSVGISLLLSFMRDAAEQKRSFQITHLPDDMRHIAEVSGLLEILPLAS